MESGAYCMEYKYIRSTNSGTELLGKCQYPRFVLTAVLFIAH